VRRVAASLDAVAARHPGQLVVVACHAGVVEASLLAKTPVVDGLDGARMQLRTQHASLTTWEVDGDRWKLIGYNDGAHHLGTEGVGGGAEGVTASGRSWMRVGTGKRIG
jgi:broad specificity phosphatase PhoE